MKTPSISTRSNAKQLLKALGITQKSIAEDIGRKPSVINAIFTSGKIAESVSDQIIKQGLTAINEKIKEKEKTDTEIDFHHVKNLLETISASLIDNYIAVLPPGRTIPDPSAPNHINRNSDTALLKYSVSNAANMVFIDGGTKSGRTSSLQKITNHSNKNTIHTVNVDFSKLKNKTSFFCHLSLEITQTIIDASDCDMPNEKYQSSIVNFFKELLQNTDNSFTKINLLLDNIDSLKIEDQKKQEELLSWLLELSEEFSGQITVFVVFSGNGWSSLARSSIKTRAMTILLPPFNKEQIEQLILAYSGNIQHAEPIYKYTLGHPYLSHIIIDAISMGEILDDIINSEINLRGNLLNHWEVIKYELKKEYRNNLHILVNIIEQLFENPKLKQIDITTNHGITADIADPLFTKFFILQGSPRKATVSGYFKHAITHDTYWINELEEE